MAIEKPAPLQIGGRYIYTLTSYEPVTIQVKVQSVTEGDIDWAFRSFFAQHDKDAAEVDDAYVAEHVEGVSTVEQLREGLRSQLMALSSQMAEEAKESLALEALAARLGQSVPESEIARTRMAMMQSFMNDMAAQGVPESELLAQFGGSPDAMERFFDRGAREVAEQEAALDAYASEKKLKVDEVEYPGLLGISPADTTKLIDDARSAGQSEGLRQHVLRLKASRVVTTECSCTYDHENPEEAAERLKKMSELDAQRKAAQAAAAADSSTSPAAGTDSAEETGKA